MLFNITLLIVTANFGLVFASLYPVEPIGSTVFPAGKPVSIRWVDNGSSPQIQTLGPLEIQLFCNDDTYIATLATNVSPISKSQMVTIPPQLVYNGSNFTIRFVANIPYDLIIYTADFTITNATGPQPSSSSSSTMHSTLSAGNATLIAKLTTLSSITSSTKPTTTSTTSIITSSVKLVTSSSRASQPTVLAPPLRPSNIGYQPENQRNAARRVDVEKLKFKVTFILWPALIGIAMAL